MYICLAFEKKDAKSGILSIKTQLWSTLLTNSGTLYMQNFTKILHVKRPVRLTVRTPGFHPGNRGSIPLRAAKGKLIKLLLIGFPFSISSLMNLHSSFSSFLLIFFLTLIKSCFSSRI